jgi:hypothetical protein
MVGRPLRSWDSSSANSSSILSGHVVPATLVHLPNEARSPEAIGESLLLVLWPRTVFRRPRRTSAQTELRVQCGPRPTFIDNAACSRGPRTALPCRWSRRTHDWTAICNRIEIHDGLRHDPGMRRVCDGMFVRRAKEEGVRVLDASKGVRLRDASCRDPQCPRRARNSGGREGNGAGLRRGRGRERP